MTERITTRSRPPRKFFCPCFDCRGKPTIGFCPTHLARLQRIAAGASKANRRAGGKMTIPGTRGQAYELEEDG